MNVEQNAKHAARATQVERQVENKTDTHNTDLYESMQANSQGMCVREKKTIIGKAQRLEIHTRENFTSSMRCLQLCNHHSKRNIAGKQCNQVSFVLMNPQRNGTTRHGFENMASCLLKRSLAPGPLVCDSRDPFLLVLGFWKKNYFSFTLNFFLLFFFAFGRHTARAPITSRAVAGSVQ